MFATVLLLAATVPAAAAGGNPWNLRCPSMPLEQPLPAVLERAARAFSPWIGAHEHGLRTGPMADRCNVQGNDVNCGHLLHRFARSLAISGRAGWRIVRTELRIGRTGCFEVSATGNGLHVTIPLSVPGPDWPTPGP